MEPPPLHTPPANALQMGSPTRLQEKHDGRRSLFTETELLETSLMTFPK